MRKIDYYIRIYKLLSGQYLKIKMQYKADTFISTFAMALVGISGIFIYYIIFNSINDLANLSYYEVMLMYSLYLIITSPANILLSNMWNLKNHLLEGTFVKYLLRPVNTLFYFVFETFDIRGIVNMIIGIICFVYSALQLQLTLNAASVIFLLIMIISGSVITGNLTILGATTGFWIMNSHFVNMFVSKLLDFTKYPLSIYTIALRIFFTFILPIGYVAFYPADFIFNGGEFNIVYVISPALAVLFTVIMLKLWNFGIKRYSGTGS